MLGVEDRTVDGCMMLKEGGGSGIGGRMWRRHWHTNAATELTDGGDDGTGGRWW